MSTFPVEYLVCPVTKKPLRREEDTLVADNGKRYSRIEDQFWSLMPDCELVADEKWVTWRHLQENGVQSYENDPEHNLGITRRSDFIAFGEFCKFHGLVLDVGCGPQKNPTHFKYCTRDGVTFFGIDPLVGEQPRAYNFIHGLGEFLPFRDKLFDQVLFVTSLDHFINPVAALIEARRVIKSDGEICVWIGEKSKDAPAPEKSPEWYRKLSVPNGADDPFHLRRFDMNEFEKYAAAALLKITQHQIIDVDQYRHNHFYKLVKN